MNNILFDTQKQVAELIKTDAELSAVTILAENSKDIDYEISEALGKQGLVAVVMTPSANYIGNFEDKSIAWEIDSLEIQVVENVTVNRGKKDEILTGQDVAMRIMDWLSSPKYGRQGMFSPISYEQGEDNGLLVNKCTFKCMVYDDNDYTDYFRFKALEDTEISLSRMNAPPEIRLEYKLDGSDWTTYNIGSRIALTAGQTLKFRAEDWNETFSNQDGQWTFYSYPGKFECAGNIMTLLDKTGRRMDVPDYCFYNLFWETYNIVSAPDLPATKLGVCCYRSMFHGSSDLEKAPRLTATELAENCYMDMFYNCDKLNEIEVAFTNWDVNATSGWFNYSAPSGTFICPEVLPEIRGINNIPEGWTIIRK